MGDLNGNNGGNPFKNIIKKVTTAVTAIAMGIKIIPILLVATLLTSLLGTIFSFVINISAAEKTVESTYSILDVKDMCELVEIKKNSSGEYYLDFIEGIDEKLEKVIKYMNSSGGVHNLPNEKEFLKEIIKTELIMRFPNLGGKVPDDSDGFQGAVNLTRITPNKEIGKLTDTGAGETSKIEQEGGYYPDNIISEYENIVKGWKKGKIFELKADCYIYKEIESDNNTGEGTGYWEEEKEEGNDKKKIIKKGTKVEYTGKYDNSKSGKKVTYVEVKVDNTTVFVKAESLVDNISEGEKTSKVKIEKTKTRNKVTSRAPSKTIGDKNKQYVIAISAGYNNTDYIGTQNGDLKEEDLNIKVAEKVEKLFEEYSNIKIVQTGSTSSNPGGIKKEDRATLIKNANPDMAVIIHFNTSDSGNETGVESIYKEGDGISGQFAEILSKKISESMGLENRGIGTDIDKCGRNLLIMENAAVTGFPTVLTKGGFINGKTDSEVIKDGGTDKYAQGIVKGIEEYIKADKEGYSSTVIGNKTAKESIESKVIKMKYVPEETFKNYVENDKKEALKVFTLDKEDGYKILTAKWSYEAGKITISENSAQDLKTSLEKYAMPFEYLLFFYMDTDYKDFSLELAKKVQESEVVMALQDNVSTTYKKITTEEKKEIDPPEYTEKAGGYDYKTVGTEEVLTENCSTSIDITYIDTWCVKSYNESSYSEDVLNMGDAQEKIINLKGTVNTNFDQINTSSEQKIDEGPIQIKIEVPKEENNNENETTTEENKQQTNAPTRRPNIMESKNNNKTTTSQSGVIIKRNINEVEDDAGGGKTTIATIDVTYTIYQRTITETDTISNQYDKGESKTDGKENVFVELYQKHKMMGLLREEWFLQILEKNEKTKNMVDLTKYLMFKATDENYGVIEYDFKGKFDLSLFNKVNRSAKGQISLTTPVLSKEKFIEAMEAYGPKSGIQGFITNFMPYAEEIYDVSVESGVNPELVVVTAQTEQSFVAGGGAYNYWGIAVYNGSNTGSSFNSLADGIKAYANVIKGYEEGDHATAIMKMYEERKAEGCNPLGYGLPGTLSGMQSRYSDICGSNTKHREGSSRRRM